MSKLNQEKKIDFPKFLQLTHDQRENKSETLILGVHMLDFNWMG